MTDPIIEARDRAAHYAPFLDGLIAREEATAAALAQPDLPSTLR